MKDFIGAAKFLLFDLASTIVFLVLFQLTHDTALSAVLGTAAGAIQIAIQLFRGKPIHIMEWLSLIFVIAGGTAAIITDDPRFVLFKPSVIYGVVGAGMLKRGWMVRYLPAIARMVAPDMAVLIGYAWAALMFATAVVNAMVAMSYSMQTWVVVMLIFGIATKVAIFALGFLAIRFTTVHRIRAMPEDKRQALLASVNLGVPASS